MSKFEKTMVTRKQKTKDINYYLRLKWTYTIEEESGKGKNYFIIRVNELPGVCTDAEDLEEGMKLIKQAMKAAFKLYIQQGETIPEPIKEHDYPGKIAYRTSSRRHYRLAKEARSKKKSLSKIIDDLVDEALRQSDS